MLKQNNIKFTIYDEITRKPFEFLSRTEYKKKMLEIIKKILQEKEILKQRGSLVVSKDQVEHWCMFVEECLSDLTNDIEDMWYNAVVIAASLDAMERLNRGAELNISYKPLDIQQYGEDVLYYNMRLTGWQNYLVTQIVCNYHDRGNDFLEYRNKFVKSPVKMRKNIKK